MNSHNHNDNTEEDKDEDEFHDDIRSDNDTNNDDGDDDDDNDDDDDDASDSDEDDEDGEEEDDEETNTSDDDSISLGPVPLPDAVTLEYTYPNDFDGGRRSWRDVVEEGRFFHLLIDPSCTEIPNSKFLDSFECCTSLTTIDLSENIEFIEREAYVDCTSLVHVTIRSSSLNLQIGGNVFGGCSALSSMTVFPSVWSQLFQSMNNEGHPNFIYKFLRDYQYQIDRLIEWKKMNSAFLGPSSKVSLIGATEDNDEGKRRRLR